MQNGFNIKEIDMKFWLIAFLFSPDGEYQAKDVYQTESYEECLDLAGRYAAIHVNTEFSTQLYCVSDDHYNGRAQDPGVPYD
jgi:hypothetical protein